MSLILNKKTLFFIICGLFSYELGAEVLPIEKKDKIVMEEYLKLHKDFFRQHCKPGTENEFNKLDKQFRGNGLFIPQLPNGQLDRLTINRFIPELKRKREWIEELKTKLQKTESFRDIKRDIKSLEADLRKLLQYKQDFFESNDIAEKNKARNESKYFYIQFKNQFEKLLDRVPFLLSYRFPNDHLELRKSYDEKKHSTDRDGKRRSNEIYFYRKIVQDGAQNPNHRRSDRMFRTGLDTLALSLKKEEDIIPENVRYDLDVTLEALKYYLRKGKRWQADRLEEWGERTSRAVDFYESLKRNKIAQDGKGYISSLELVKGKAKARYVLKDYVLKQEAKTYKFWKRQSELMQALYSIETILYNEVGGIDGRDALERRDVAQVVINRSRLPRYSTIEPKEGIYSYLEKKSEQEGKVIESNPWLNVLFKEGEFSFTYFFIHGNLRIYCPSQNRRARFLRRENLRIALELLRKPNDDFKALRYFSRSGMTGRYNMDSLWSNYAPLPERPGRPAKRSSHLKRLYRKGNYAYRYNFTDHKGLNYRVLKMMGSTYVMPLNQEKFYKYRSPHQFRYFEEITSE